MTSPGQGDVLRRLRSAQVSKHKLLLAAIMRMAASTSSARQTRTLTNAYRLLTEVETRDQAVVHDLIASPEFGAWAADCVSRLTGGRPGHFEGQPMWADLTQLAAIAATAAFRAGHEFELEVPLRHGAVTFPAFGTARTGALVPWDWGLVSQDSRGRRVRSAVSTVTIPAAETASAAWAPVPRLTAEASGLRLEVTLDSHDPFLDRYGTARAVVPRRGAVRWQRLLSEAWPVLAGRHYPLAEIITDVVRTLVPLRAPSPTRPVSSTETSSFGALGLSLPGDALRLAEVLVHESHHAVLGAVMDIVPMFRAGQVPMTYAPWREDPRPASALLQGIYTHYGVSRFWRKQRRAGCPQQRFRGHVEFGRWRLLTAQTADRLAGWDALTEAGDSFLSAIRSRLAEWQDEPLAAGAADHIADLSVEHCARWRLRHLVPDQAAVQSLAEAWRRAARPPVSPATITAALEPGPLPAATDNARAYLLGLRYQDPAGLREACLQPGADPADVALASGDFARAADGYLARIDGGDDGDAWAGLAVACRHTGPPRVARLLAERPEVPAALYRRLRGSEAAAGAVTAWLADAS